jgi:hypothetical protein
MMHWPQAAANTVGQRCPLSFPIHTVTHGPKPPLNSYLSHTRPTPTSSSNFQVIFNHALNSHERRSKKDRLVHPLSAQLQSCNSPSSLIVLQQQVQELNQSRSSDERLTKWLNPIVNVLYTFSETLGEGGSLVCLTMSTCRDVHSHSYFIGILTSESDLCWSWYPPFSVYLP